MFGRRRNRANFHNNQYYPIQLNYHELGLFQNDWRQQQTPYYPSHLGHMGHMGHFNSPYNQPYSYDNHAMHQNTFPMHMAPQHLIQNQYPTNMYPVKQNGMSLQQNDFSQTVFQNPLDPEGNQHLPAMQNPYFSNSYMNPYPKQSFIPNKPSGVQSIMNSFKTQDGSLDFNKMMNTAGQMMGAVNQVSSLVKGLGGIIKV